MMTTPGRRIERTVTGPEVAAGAWTVRPSVRVTGRQVSTDRAAGGGGYWSLRAEPAAVTLTAPDGATSELALPGDPKAAIAGMMRAGALVALACALVALIARRR